MTCRLLTFKAQRSKCAFYEQMFFFTFYFFCWTKKKVKLCQQLESCSGKLSLKRQCSPQIFCRHQHPLRNYQIFFKATLKIRILLFYYFHTDKLIEVDVKPTFFRNKSRISSFSVLKLRYNYLGRKEISAKAAFKMLVKLTFRESDLQIRHKEYTNKRQRMTVN